MRKIAVLFSGGIESACLLTYYLVRKYVAVPVYVKCGFPWEKVELDRASRLWSHMKRRFPNLLPMRITSIKGVRKKGRLEIPLRNFFLVSATASVAVRKGMYTLAVGSLGLYPFPDNNRRYFDDLERLISTGLRRPFRIETPFMELEKEEVIRAFYRLVPLELSFSCIRPVRGKHCGVCEKCMERKEAFTLAEVKDPTPYSS